MYVKQYIFSKLFSHTTQCRSLYCLYFRVKVKCDIITSEANCTTTLLKRFHSNSVCRHSMLNSRFTFTKKRSQRAAEDHLHNGNAIHNPLTDDKRTENRNKNINVHQQSPITTASSPFMPLITSATKWELRAFLETVFSDHFGITTRKFKQS